MNGNINCDMPNKEEWGTEKITLIWSYTIEQNFSQMINIKKIPSGDILL